MFFFINLYVYIRYPVYIYILLCFYIYTYVTLCILAHMKLACFSHPGWKRVAGHGENCLVEPLLSGDSKSLSSPRDDNRQSRVNERIDARRSVKIQKKKNNLLPHTRKTARWRQIPRDLVKNLEMIVFARQKSRLLEKSRYMMDARICDRPL